MASLAPPAVPLRASRRRAPRRLCAPTRAAASAQAPPRRVAVVGAGVAGLTMALALKRLCPSAEAVDVYEAEGDAELRADRGAALNLNGGAAVLTDLGLGPQLMALANPMETVVARTVGGTTLFELSLAQALRGQEGALYRNGKSCCVTVLRASLARTLLAAATAAPGVAVLPGQRVASARVAADGGSAIVTLAGSSGEERSYDLVIGADGLRSAVRAALLGAAAPPAPLYAGVRIAFAVVPRTTAAAEKLRPSPSEVHQWFAPGAYALAYSAGRGLGAHSGEDAGAHCLALCWGDTASAAENPRWDATAVRSALLSRLRAASFPPEILALAAAADERAFELGVRYHAPLPAGSWAHPSGRMLILGDAAHAMPPFLGQGANQAIQDAAALASRLARVGTPQTPTLAAAAAAFEAVRLGPTAALQTSSRFVGLLDTLPSPWHPLRDLSLAFAGRSGIAAQIFINGALPRV